MIVMTAMFLCAFGADVWLKPNAREARSSGLEEGRPEEKGLGAFVPPLKAMAYERARPMNWHGRREHTFGFVTAQNPASARGVGGEDDWGFGGRVKCAAAFGGVRRMDERQQPTCRYFGRCVRNGLAIEHSSPERRERDRRGLSWPRCGSRR